MPRVEPLWSWRRAALACSVALAGVLSWPVLGGASEATLRTASNGLIGRLTFGQGGHAAFRRVTERKVARRPAYDDDASWSTHVELRIDGFDDRSRVRINARRLIYLPCVTLAALVLASPLSWRRKALALALGFWLLIGAALLSVWLMVAWLFALVPGLVYDLSAFERLALDFGYEALVTALGNRYITPLVIAVVLILSLSPKTERTLTRDGHTPVV